LSFSRFRRVAKRLNDLLKTSGELSKEVDHQAHMGDIDGDLHAPGLAWYPDLDGPA